MHKSIRSVSQHSHWKILYCQLHQNLLFSTSRILNEPLAADADDPPYTDVPKPPTSKSERKPYPTPMKLLIQRAKEEREARRAHPCRMLEHPPDNGLLVPELVEIAHRVWRAYEFLLVGLSKLVQAIPVHRCRFCFEVHIGRVGHEIRTCTGPNSGFRNATHAWRKGGVQDIVFFPKSYHLYDCVGKPRVGHDERYSIPKVPAILELCMQAGVDLVKYPTRRRTKPVYSIEGRIVDFESVTHKNEMESDLYIENIIGPLHESNFGMKTEEMTNTLGEDSSFFDKLNDNEGKDLSCLSIKTLDSWLDMVSGAKKIMEKYSVKTCGYCPEIQVGPKGHKVRMCKASKHQSRNGLHAWQEATVEDLIGPNFVWHVSDTNGPALDNNLKRYYGKAPAVIELCVQAGAPVPNEYRSMMRLDVVPPDRDEVDLVA